MDPQNILLLIIVILAVVLLVLGIQAFLVLKDIKSTINKANKVLDTTEVITQNFSGISLLASLVKSLITKGKGELSPSEKKPKSIKSLEIKVSINGENKKLKRRFFRGIRRFR